MALDDDIRVAQARAYRLGQESMRGRAEDVARIVAVTGGEGAGERARGVVAGALAAERAIRGLPILDWEER